MKRIKVCFISFFAYPMFDPKTKGEFGGAELQLYYMGTELAKDERFDISFITDNFGQPDNQVIEQVKLYKLDLPPGAVPLTRTLREYARLWRLLKKIDADVYIQRAAGLNTGLIALFCRVYGKKFIYMVAHDNDVLRNQRPSWMPCGMIGAVIWSGFKFGLRNSALVIVQHDRQKEYLKRYYGKEGVLRPSAHRVQDSYVHSDKKHVLWVARCEEWKQPETFLNLAKSFPDEKFVMVCPVSRDTEYFERIKGCALNLPNLQFVDYVPFNEIEDYFSKAKIFINTSKEEGFPNTFIQAFKNRTPVLSMDVNPDGMLEKYDIGRCANGNFEQLKLRFADLLINDQLRKKFSENAFKYVEENHDITKIIDDDKKYILEVFNAGKKASRRR